MKSKYLCTLAIVLNLPLAYAQDFQKKYKIPPKGTISIISYNGNIRVCSHSGKDIEVLAYKKGPDRDFLEVQDNSSDSQISLSSRYLQFGRGNAVINFEIRVPISFKYNFFWLQSISGDIEVDNVRGRFNIVNSSGNVDIRDVQGWIEASSINGKISSDLVQTPLSSNILLRSISGSILVRAPANLNAEVRMKSDAGLQTDFPMEIRNSRYGSGKSAYGKLGTGSPNITIQSLYGHVSLLQKQ